MQIYVDATGGDNAPNAIIDGAMAAVDEYKVSLSLLGDEAVLKNRIRPDLLSNGLISLIHVTQTIDMNEEPVKAVRTKKDSALVVGTTLVKSQSDKAFISAGSTGAVLSAALLVDGRLKGVKRPALSTVLPGKTPTLLIDNGANADCKPEYLAAFARMGSVYMKIITGKNTCNVGLANIGTEDVKGSQLYKDAFELLKQDSALSFIGNVETKEIFTTDADVLCCDGFTGNMILKTIEGTSKYVIEILKDVFYKNSMNKIAGMIIKKDMQELKARLDPSAYGGVPLLGVDANIIKAHGSSDAIAIKNAVFQAMKLIQNDMLTKVAESLE